ncbi:MAG: trypsin-like peptidase domain-containing protein [Gloeomargaritaceae cyanobacterium C42_A2020_066]|nr:trypsin-like peptidase domain-containing protein [Gloeomargaritaceae cyanobacterium C42_A2020_066]
MTRPRTRRFSLLQFLTHGLALLVGVVLTVVGIRALPSQADLLRGEPTQTLVAEADPQTTAAVPSRSGRLGANFVIDATRKVGPAVVRIDTERRVVQAADPFLDDPFFRRFFGDDLGPRGQRERRERGQGSGFITDTRGTVITNAHVVQGADKVTVTLTDGRQFPGVVRGTDEVTDLAVVQIQNPTGTLPVAPLGNSDQLQVGDWAIAMGNPLGLDNTVTLGIVSNLSRSSSKVGIPDKRLDFIQTDAAINPGNSGGPLLNADGQVIGINTAIRAGAEGIGFAIPINTARRVTPILAEGREVPHPYIGIAMVSLTPELAREANENPNSTVRLPEVKGALVSQVIPDSPAAKGGLRRGDVITEIDGKRVDTADDLQKVVEQTQVGERLPVKVRRGDQTLSLTVRTGDRKQVLRQLPPNQ